MKKIQQGFTLIEVMVVLVVLAFNFMGDGLRDAADPEAQIPVFEQRISSEHNRLMLQLQQALAAAELPIAADRIRKLKFVRKLRDELSRLEDSLMDL